MRRNNCCKNNFFSYFSFQKLIKLFSLCEVGMSPTNFKLTISPNALAEAVAENSTLKEQLTVAQLDSTFYEREHNATWAALCSVRSTLDPGTEITAAVIALPAASRIFLLKLSGRAEKQGSYPPRRKARQLRRRASTLIELRTTLRHGQPRSGGPSPTYACSTTDCVTARSTAAGVGHFTARLSGVGHLTARRPGCLSGLLRDRRLRCRETTG
jgi:hypothetical protein